ncbi:thiol-disulfide oxidoreductase [Paenibacillus glucanolyticus]|uniref:Thiol-disulfide oxidoreductase n=1 Tax=Paenibacillus glucanolyticus TaxID=59843 RepID=A0A163L7W6_9BACL|nr:redoxin domain-containing protein [Paenibacillus glucanolyticus]KZS47880.1 thiol-disulfide oxidoreductase [Paenibacillus glucanolyticus]
MNRLAHSSWIRRLILALVTAAGIYALVHALLGDQETAEIGQTAPDFEAVNLQDEPVRLSDYRGQPVLLNFWASWCGPCVNEMPILNEAYAQESGTQIIAVNIGESREKAEAFASKHHLEMPIVLDQHNTIKGQYGISGLPVTVLIDDQGKMVDRVTGELPSLAFVKELMSRIQ